MAASGQVGNKCDMLDELQVTEEEGRAKASGERLSTC